MEKISITGLLILIVINKIGKLLNNRFLIFNDVLLKRPLLDYNNTSSPTLFGKCFRKS